ncbi:KTSC domain-containing protein [Mesorhizobium sp.]|uniref:KTSC domain-containing protein n=1 Tax=Mesorhizobium sp. TaxID=1871066 RepID=UPI0025BF255A|nr:KTSC domain-containing protein [Mesorhizobium sp.]
MACPPPTSVRCTTIHRQEHCSFGSFQAAYRYDYENVGPDTYSAFRAASSKGRSFNEFVRDRYRYRLMEHGPRH